jgi:hypothetical protein
VITPGLAKSLRISTLTSLGDFLSSFLESGNGSVEMRDLRKPGMDSNVEFNCVFDFCRKLVRSWYACGPPA